MISVFWHQMISYTQSNSWLVSWMVQIQVPAHFTSSADGFTPREIHFKKLKAPVVTKRENKNTGSLDLVHPQEQTSTNGGSSLILI